jgi:hypothetical protein
LAARDVPIVSLREENDRLRAKVAMLAEIAFGGSERRRAKGHNSDEGVRDLGDDFSDTEGCKKEVGA